MTTNFALLLMDCIVNIIYKDEQTSEWLAKNKQVENSAGAENIGRMKSPEDPTQFLTF